MCGTTVYAMRKTCVYMLEVDGLVGYSFLHVNHHYVFSYYITICMLTYPAYFTFPTSYFVTLTPSIGQTWNGKAGSGAGRRDSCAGILHFGRLGILPLFSPCSSLQKLSSLPWLPVTAASLYPRFLYFLPPYLYLPTMTCSLLCQPSLKYSPSL